MAETPGLCPGDRARGGLAEQELRARFRGGVGVSSMRTQLWEAAGLLAGALVRRQACADARGV